MKGYAYSRPHFCYRTIMKWSLCDFYLVLCNDKIRLKENNGKCFAECGFSWCSPLTLKHCWPALQDTLPVSGDEVVSSFMPSCLPSFLSVPPSLFSPSLPSFLSLSRSLSPFFPPSLLFFFRRQSVLQPSGLHSVLCVICLSFFKHYR